MRKLLISLIAVLVLAGCQAAPQPTEEEPVEESVLPVPYSEGPSGPPSVRGPTSPPPGTGGDLPQSITEEETVEYTLPPDTEAEFKY